MPAKEPKTDALRDETERFPLAARIRVLGCAATPSQFTLSAGKCTIGAGEGAEIVIDSPTVSRRHVQLELVPEGLRVTDLGSRNGTFYLGQRIGELTVGLGSHIRLGVVELELSPASDDLGASRRAKLESYDGIIGASAVMQALFATLQRLEGSLVSVLLEGESGTGKEVVARAIHGRSLVANAPFVAVNCGALDRALARSELFGHIRGSFTGATEARVGAFESANGGTVFLDEIGDLPAEVQPLLLRALENQRICRVGETVERPVKVRVLAATNKDLRDATKSGAFREDLYYRLAVVKLRLPALRERREDIGPLARHLAGELGCQELPEEIAEEMKTRDWPGNVRELKNALSAYLAIGALAREHNEATVNLDKAFDALIDLDVPYAELKERLNEAFLRSYVQRLLRHTGGNQTEAARVSGIERSYFSKIARRVTRGPND
jgi:DNA-binding NtrC family response regulator